ncbi:MAG TPA: low-specificity L-threonine aldolase [Dehalococcoidia bacterium]|nr:low-specificity L-threonine aldolase [Dehalococcoidia bacterium]
MIDLRSDTVTLPSPEMRQAMAGAELGDDVFHDDPTVNKLEALAAERLGKEAALLTTSGTQSNLVAMLTHCRRGDEVVVGDESHILHYEVGGAFALGGLGLRPVRNDAQGRLDLAEVEAVIRARDVHFPRTGLICMENTHNRCGGAVLSEADLAAVRELADRHGLPVHLDGARLFNAAVALSLPVSQLARYADSVSFSLCKGLGCPIGSVLCGSRQFIVEARHYRKMLGGGMRQAGIIAAAGIFALDRMVERLADDHRNAQLLAGRLGGIPGVALAPPPQTNLVFFTVEGWALDDLARRLGEAGVLCLDEGGRLRMVTHYGIEAADVEAAATRLRSIVAAGA